MNIRWIIIACFIITGQSLVSQVSVSDFIESARQDSFYLRLQSLADFRKSHPQSIKWIDKIELRTQTNEFDFNQEQYGLRLYGSKPSDIKYTKERDQLDYSYYTSLANTELAKSISKKYTTLGELINLQKEEHILNEWITLNNKKNKYLESLFNNQLDADLKDLIQSVRKKETSLLRRKEFENKKELFNKNYGVINIQLQEVITIEEIQIFLLSSSELNTSTATDFISAQYEMNKIALEKKQLKNAKWDILDFVTARWQNKNNDILFREKFGLGAGFRIPYSGTHKKNLNQNQFESAFINNQWIQKEQSLKIKANQFKNELLALIVRYHQEKQKLDEFKNKFNVSKLSSSSLVTAHDILFLEESILEWKEDINKLDKEIFEKYIDYINLSQIHAVQPLKNYLLQGFPLIAN